MQRSFKLQVEAMQKKHRNQVLDVDTISCFVSAASLRIPEHLSVVPTQAHSDTLSFLPPFTGCMRAGGAESIFLSSGFSRAGPQVAPHAHSAPRLSGTRSSSLSAWKRQFLGEPALTNLAFFSLKG